MEKVFHWTNVMLGVGDNEASGQFDEVVKTITEIAEYGITLADERRARPRDDLTTNLVQAEVDGERLTSAEIASFFILLSAAGNETTRNFLDTSRCYHPPGTGRWVYASPTGFRPLSRQALGAALLRRAAARRRAA